MITVGTAGLNHAPIDVLSPVVTGVSLTLGFAMDYLASSRHADPSEESIAALEDIISQNPLSAWIFAHRCPVSARVSQADLLIVLAAPARILETHEREVALAARHAHIASALEDLPAARLARVQRQAEQLEVQTPMCVASARSRL